MLVNLAKDLSLAGASQWSARYINHGDVEQKMGFITKQLLQVGKDANK